MALKTSLIIDGDASGASKAVGDATRAVGQLDSASKGAAGSLAAGSRAQGELATTARTLASAQGQAAGATRDAGVASSYTEGTQRRLAAATSEAERAAAAAALAQLKLSEAQRKLGQGSGAVAGALKGNTDEMRRQAFGARNLGQQFGDLGLSIAGGISPARAFGQQAGQVGFALSEMGGKAGAVGAFLVGPWGIFLTVATAVLAPFVEKLFETETAAGAAEAGTSSLASAQGVLGQIFDLTTGKIQKQTQSLIVQARVMANTLEAQGKAKQRAGARIFGDVGELGAGAVAGSVAIGVAKGLIPGGRSITLPGERERGARLEARAAVQKRVLDDAQAGRITADQAVVRLRSVDDRGLKRSNTEVTRAIQLVLEGKEDRLHSREIDRSLNTGSPSAIFRRDAPARAGPTSRAGAVVPSTEARDEFGRDTADKIAGIVGQFDTAPGAIDKINAKVRELDALIGAAGRKRPDNFRELIASAEAAKETVRTGIVRELGEAFAKPKTLADRAAVAFGQLDAVAASLEGRTGPDFDKTIAQLGEARRAITEGLNEPLNDFLGQQREQYAQGQLIVQGRTAEAEAMRAIVAIERQRGPLAAEQRAEVLASVAALRQQEGQLERVRAKQQVNLDALEDQRDIIRQTISEGPKSLAALPGRILDSFKNYSVEKLTEDLFGDLFRDLRDQATGANKVDDATQTLVGAFTEAATSARQLSGALAGASGGPGDASAPGAVSVRSAARPARSSPPPEA